MKGGLWDGIRLLALLMLGFLLMFFAITRAANFPFDMFWWRPFWICWGLGVLHSIAVLVDNSFFKEYEQTIGSLFGISLVGFAVFIYVAVI